MTVPRHTLCKDERLSWKRHIDGLFDNGRSFIAFPLRVVYLFVEGRMPARCMIMASVSKKRFKRAVKRNLIKRQIREAYRTRKQGLTEPLLAADKNLLVAFLYIDNQIHPFSSIEKAMDKAIRLLADKEE